MLPRCLFQLALFCGPLISIQANDVPVCYSIDEGLIRAFTFKLVSCYENVERITHRFQSRDDVSIENFVQFMFMEETKDNKHTTTNVMTTTDDINLSSLMSNVYTTEVTEASDSTWSSSSFVMSTEGFSSDGLQSTEVDQTTTVGLTTTRQQEHTTEASTSSQFSTPVPSAKVTTDLSTSERITTSSVIQVDQTTTVGLTTTRQQEYSTEASTSSQFSTPVPSTKVTTDLSTSERITTSSVIPCLNWMAYNDEFSFCVSPVALSWYDAVENCRGYSNNARLVHIDSDEKTKAIVDYRGTEGSNYSWMWIGVNDIETEGVWKLEDNTAVDATPFWGDGEPNGNTGDKADQDCVFAIQNGEWRDYPCTEELHFICEKKTTETGAVSPENTDLLRQMG